MEGILVKTKYLVKLRVDSFQLDLVHKFGDIDVNFGVE
jgi:hypothetical protein